MARAVSSRSRISRVMLGRSSNWASARVNQSDSSNSPSVLGLGGQVRPAASARKKRVSKRRGRLGGVMARAKKVPVVPEEQTAVVLRKMRENFLEGEAKARGAMASAEVRDRLGLTMRSVEVVEDFGRRYVAMRDAERAAGLK